jgi:hypothetical protein
MQARTQPAEFGANVQTSLPGLQSDGSFVHANQGSRGVSFEVIVTLGYQPRTLAGEDDWSTTRIRQPSSRNYQLTRLDTTRPSVHQRVAIQSHREDWP